MPIYEYRCPKCGVFDHMQKISEAPLKRCPTCKGKVAKQMSNPAFHLKGGGWYITDYARKGGGSGSEAKPSADGGEASGGEANADKKADKAEKKAAKKSETAASAAA